MSKISEFHGASFSSAEMENYLEQLAERGWEVFRKRDNHYLIVFDEDREIEILYGRDSKKWHIYHSSIHKYPKVPPDLHESTSFHHFTEQLKLAAEYLGEQLDVGPRNIRLKQATPAANMVSLAAMAKGAPVRCIFDPYFEDKSIAVLNTLVNLGLPMDGAVRVLATSRMKSRLSKVMIDSFNVEKCTSLDIRYCECESEHRRFLILSTGEILIIGCSLNSLSKNEAAHIEDSQNDRDFFEQQWKKASPM